MNDDENSAPKDPQDDKRIADAYAPPDPGGSKQIVTGIIVLVAVAIVVFLILIAVR